MKLLVFLALILISANCGYTLWDMWHNVPKTWVPTPSNIVSSIPPVPAGYTRNGPNSPHPSGYFNNYTNIYTQYLYWNNEDPNAVTICSPKYYLYDDHTCKADPYYMKPEMPTFCQPNYYNH